VLDLDLRYLCRGLLEFMVAVDAGAHVDMRRSHREPVTHHHIAPSASSKQLSRKRQCRNSHSRRLQDGIVEVHGDLRGRGSVILDFTPENFDELTVAVGRELAARPANELVRERGSITKTDE
jgi:hypothetical protein